MKELLREKIAAEIDKSRDDIHCEWPDSLEAADRILAIPEIARALKAAEEGCQVCESARG